MRIAILIKSTTLHKNYGGLESQNKNLAEGLVAAGHEVVVITPGFGGDNDAVIDCNGVGYLFIKNANPGKYSREWWEGSLREFTKLHSERPFNIVISQSAGGAAIINHQAELGIKTIVISHGTLWGEVKTVWKKTKSLKDYLHFGRVLGFGLKTYFLLDKKYLSNCSYIVAVSEEVKKALILELKLPENKIRVIKNGIDLSQYVVSSQEDFPTRFLYLGRQEKEKGLEILVIAFSRLVPELPNEVSLTIVGNGPYQEELGGLINKLELQPLVKVTSAVSYDQIPKLLSSYSVLVLPSMRLEGLPMVLVEAAASGLPIIASDIGGIKSAVKGKVNGLLVKSGSSRDLYAAMKTLASSVLLRKEYGLNSRRLAEAEFSLTTMITKYSEVIESIL